MSQPKNPRRVAENEALAIGNNLRSSTRKLNLVAEQIRGKAVSTALAELAFSKKHIARDVKKVLESAIANAENNHQLDVDSLYVSQATVGRSLAMRRFHARARGRAAGVVKEFSNITVVVRERAEAASEE
ncbi:50S ribosomal protein L22 [Zavarzinia compransoris]|uniref:Large ribosomal subunit protein uL22 n=1 Tax=Zavarzinia compransoris TaxID=1264899 RepID=A0A317DWI4_9PROT|nr:50S ribosomal protein L22 [Zavarzinia compransoris]PWR19078.1 50S ribosomal protein L22 [Zavarzinia compransoris]TDP49087.1 LSU ribosomal protein L22P [Zavarzinia compransoris]